MNIYFSKEINRIYFFGDSVSFHMVKPISILNRGLSFVVFCITQGINEMDRIAHELANKFNVIDDMDNIKKMVLSCTIENKSLERVFTLDINNANISPKILGVMGKRYPETLHMELTGACNFRCSHCYKNATYKGKYVEFDWIRSKINDKFKGSISVIHLTGGEPTLHRDFSKIVNLLCEDYILQLTTNGSRILSYPIELLKKFSAIDISLYGLTADEYLFNTGDARAFERVKAGCIYLSESNIKFRVTLVINNDNWHQMEDYVQYAIDVGADRIGFGLPSNGGKLLLDTPDKWYIVPETKKKIYRKFREIQNNYRDTIGITEWARTAYSDIWKSNTKDESLRCGAGTKDWWMSEKYTFRPCSFLPEEYVTLDYEQWYGYITNVNEVDWAKARKCLELFAEKNNREITDFCSIFRQ